MRRVLLACALALGCHGDIASDGTPAAALPGVVDLEPGPSLYALSVKLVDQDGATMPLDAWRGHPVLVGMFYASCPNACPLFVSTLKDVEKSLDERTRAAVRVLLVSFDPNDTPQVLSRLAARHRVDTTRWRLASASEDGVRDLAAALGVKYRKLPDGGYNHSSPLILLGPDGAIHSRVESVGDATGGLTLRLRALARSY